MTAAHGEMARRSGGDGDSLSPPASNGQMKNVLSGIAVRREADGAGKDFKPPQKSLTERRDQRIPTFDIPGRSWEYAIWEMSAERLLKEMNNMCSIRWLMPVLALMVVLATSARAGAKPVFRKPPPEGVVELVNIAGSGSALVELKDGSIMLLKGGSYRISTDGGVTWSDGRSLGKGISGNGIIRLQSGALALTGGLNMWLSQDEGKTWGPALPLRTLRGHGQPYYHDTMIQLSTGRLVLASHYCFRNPQHPDVGYGGHSTYPELLVSLIAYSDDEGQTWHVGPQEPKVSWVKDIDEWSAGILMGWFDYEGTPNGEGGVTECSEPNVAETKDGRVLFFARSPTGRIVYSYSSDGGELWLAVRPTELNSSSSPNRLRRIPQTGDLLCVWNQVSPEENEYGWRRHRLSAAISQDDGATWGHFKTLELSAGLEDIDRLEAKLPIKWSRAGSNRKSLPPDKAEFTYPNVCFAGDKVYIMYHRAWRESGEGRKVEQVMRIYPVEYFYQ